MKALPRVSIVRQSALSARTVLLITLAFLAALISGPIVSASPARAESFPSVLTAEKTFISKINYSRSAKGLRKLAPRGDLTLNARAWAKKMAAGNTLKHNPSLTYQVRNWSWVGENVGVGGNVSELHTAFMKSPGHRANVLHSKYSEVGVGVAYGNGRMWVVEVFRRPMS
ncbi:MAG: CAP domain-containing protein [Actinomycetota bacterium]